MQTHPAVGLLQFILWFITTKHTANMDCSRRKVLYLRVVTEDVDSFDNVAELYFEARDNADDEEAYDSPWDEEDSSESGEESNEEEEFVMYYKPRI